MCVGSDFIDYKGLLKLYFSKMSQVQGRGRHWLDDTTEEQGKGVRVNAKVV